MDHIQRISLGLTGPLLPKPRDGRNDPNIAMRSGRLLAREKSACSGNDSANAERDVEFVDTDSASDDNQGMDDIIRSNNSDYEECNTVDDETDESQDGGIQQ